MGWTYNAPDGTPTEGPKITGLSLAFTAFSLTIVCLRLYVRTILIKAAGYDDLIIIVAWLGACVYAISAVIQTKWGLGLTALDDMPDENVYNFGLYIGAPFYVVGIWGFKMSLLLSYLRFVPKGTYYMTAVVVAVLISMAHIAFVCVFLFLCTPVQKQWDPAIPAHVGHCAEGVQFYLSFSALTIVFDVLVMILPFPVILRSQIQRRKKLVLLGLFVLGVFVTIIQAIRIQTIRNLANYLDSAKSITWSIIENNIGIVIASVPTLAPLVKAFTEKTRSGAGEDSRKQSSYAMQTWRSKKSGLQHLGSGVDCETSISGPGRLQDDDSTENILEPVGITKRTEVRVTSQNHRQ